MPTVDPEAAQELLEHVAEHPVLGSCLLHSALAQVGQACQAAEKACLPGESLASASVAVNAALAGLMMSQVHCCVLIAVPQCSGRLLMKSLLPSCAAILYCQSIACMYMHVLCMASTSFS